MPNLLLLSHIFHLLVPSLPTMFRLTFLLLLAIGLAQARISPLQPQGGNAECAAFCRGIYSKPALTGHCISAAARNLGPCYQCGPKSPSQHPDVCLVGTD